MIKVGAKYKDGDKEKTYHYRDVRCRKTGWVDPKKYLPADFDMVFIKLKYPNHKGKYIIAGWTQGEVWEAVTLTHDNEVLGWKKYREFYHE